MKQVGSKAGSVWENTRKDLNMAAEKVSTTVPLNW
jgi:hypothetical protein